MKTSSWLKNLRNRLSRPPMRGPIQKSATARLRVQMLEDRTAPSAGALDPTFGSGGIVNIPPSGYNAAAVADMVVQADGKIMTAGIGRNINNAYPKFALARYDASGSLDPTFGTGGKVTTSIGNYGDSASAVVRQTDGKYVVAGLSGHFDKGFTANNDMVLVRYNANGSLDTTFGSKGIVGTPFAKASTDEASAVVLQADGKIVVAGWVSDSTNDFALVRYTAAGALDTAFGTGGKVRVHIDSGGVNEPNNGWPIKLVIQPNGRMVVSGTVGVNGVTFAALVRVNANGTLDTSFGTGGKVVVALGDSGSQANGLALQPDGKIVIVGNAVITLPSGGQPYVVALARFNSDGTFDNTFDGDGRLTIDLNSTPYHEADLSAVAIEGDGKIIAVGATNTSNVYGTSQSDFAMIRVNADGSLDSTFGSGGVVFTAVTSSGDTPNAVALQTDGRIVVGGTALARYLAAEPQIGSFTADPNPVTAGSNTTLTATNIQDPNPNATITQVAFYRDTNGDGVLDASDLLLGYGTQDNGTWTLTFSTAGLTSGTYTLFAVVTDSYGVTGAPAALNLELT